MKAGGVAAALGWLMTMLVATPASGLADWQSFQISVDASAMQVRIVSPAAPLADVDDDTAGEVRALAAEGRLDDIGTSTGRAIAISPGDTPISVLGLARSAATNAEPAKRDEVRPLLDEVGPLLDKVLNQVHEVPPMAASSHPSAQEEKYGSSPFTVRSKSTERRSEAATLLEGPTSARATALVERADDGQLVADARTELVGLEVGPLQIGRLWSQSRIVRQIGGPATVESTLQATGVRLGGAAVELQRGDVRELPGATVRYLGGQATKTGIRSPVVEFSLDIPVSMADKSPPSRIVVTLGETNVDLTGEAGDDFEDDFGDDFSLEDFFENVVIDEAMGEDGAIVDEYVDDFASDLTPSTDLVDGEDGIIGEAAGSSPMRDRSSRGWAWAAGIALVLSVAGLAYLQRRSLLKPRSAARP